MLSSPTSSSASSSSSSSISNSTLHPEHAFSGAHRRRSVDNGGLSLALNDHSGSGSGKGWGGWETDPTHVLSGSTDYAELVLAMREQTATTIDGACPGTSPSLIPPSELEIERVNLIHILSSWHFDTSQLSPDKALKCASLLFESLWTIEGMENSIGFGFESMHPFLARISKIYRRQTSYHNFQHAVDVLQATYCYLHEAGCVPGVDILLEEPPSDGPDEGCCEAPVTSTRDINLPPKRRRKMWRKPPLEGKRETLLRRALRNQDLFALCVAAIGHDIAHPGVSNKFLSNAKAPLAELFDDVSVLEKFHCTILLQVMRTHNMVHLLDRIPPRQHRAQYLSTQSRLRTGSDPGIINRSIDPAFVPEGRLMLDTSPPGTPLKPSSVVRHSTVRSTSRYPGTPDTGVVNGTGTEFRDLLMKAILATDMSVHFKWMSKMDHLLQRVHQDEDLWGSDEEVDSETRLLLCQALIKCADISNPSRPVPICKHWSSSLNSEWAEQALLEKQLELPISVTASDDPIEAGKGQVAFIETFAMPLLQVTSAVIPEMEVFVQQCDANLVMWKTKISDLQRKNMNGGSQDLEGDHASEDSPTTPPPTLPTSPPDVSTMFALSLPTTLHTPVSERTQTCWPDRTCSPFVPSSQSDNTDSGHDELVTAASPFGSRSSSPPNRWHTLYTQLPHVSIPPAASTTFSPSNSQHTKSSSTTSVTSPLFSPHSIPTSFSSPRSDCSSSPMPSVVVQTRPGLRAAYESNGRPKAIKRVENRISWQGSVAGSLATVLPIEPSIMPPASTPSYVSDGS